MHELDDAGIEGGFDAVLSAPLDNTAVYDVDLGLHALLEVLEHRSLGRPGVAHSYFEGFVGPLAVFGAACDEGIRGDSEDVVHSDPLGRPDVVAFAPDGERCLSPCTNGALVVCARWPAPRFVAPHSTVPTTRFSSPTIAAMRSCTSPLPKETNALARSRSTRGPRADSRWGALRVMRAKSKGPSRYEGSAWASRRTWPSSPSSSSRRPGSIILSTCSLLASRTLTRRTPPSIFAAVTPPMAPAPTTRTLASIMRCPFLHRRVADPLAARLALRSAGRAPGATAPAPRLCTAGNRHRTWCPCVPPRPVSAAIVALRNARRGLPSGRRARSRTRPARPCRRSGTARRRAGGTRSNCAPPRPPPAGRRVPPRRTVPPPETRRSGCGWPQNQARLRRRRDASR